MEKTVKDEILHLAHRGAFHQFAIVTSTGDRYRITDVLGLALGKTELAYYFPKSNRSIRLPYAKIASVERLAGNGSTRKIRRGNG